MKKIILIVLDGLGDGPIPDFNGKTPLEAARTPNLDKLAEEGISGMVKPVFTTAVPTSEEGHFVLFGYNPEKYKIQRGIFTAEGAGIKLKKGDVALRGNFGTVDESMNVLDRRAGRIKKTEPLIKALKGITIGGVKFLIKKAGDYRVGIVLRGKGLSSNISDGDPHYGSLGKGLRKVKPLDKSSEARFTAEILNKFLEKTHQILKNHPYNKERKKKGLLPANYILVREAGSFQKIPSFKKRYGLKACCVAGKFLYQQIAKKLGMKIIKVEGATGLPDTNLKGKFEAVLNNLDKYDFVFLHIKATDSLAEDGNFKGKKEFIEKVDKEVKPLFELEDVLIIVTADHSTCSLLKRHCKRSFPILIYGNGKDSVKEFSEKACQRGDLAKIRQLDIMDKVVAIAKEKKI